MTWRESQASSRRRLVESFSENEAKRYDEIVGILTEADRKAYISDLETVFSFKHGLSVLDVGAGTGAMCQLLSEIEGLHITALEPAKEMLKRLRNNCNLKNVTKVEGFSDCFQDRQHFRNCEFDVIISRQLCNGLYDPLQAFRNWHFWLKPKGIVLILDGFYQRSSWSGIWKNEVDLLPLSAFQSIALLPYLLEQAGFHIEAVKLMASVNELPSTKTERFLISARKQS